jgi:hypothetical protein
MRAVTQEPGVSGDAARPTAWGRCSTDGVQRICYYGRIAKNAGVVSA